MGKHCFVPNCNSGYSSCREKVSIFGAPKDNDLLSTWSKVIGRKDRLLTSKDSVCEKHFEPHLVLRDWTMLINGVIHSQPRGIPRLADKAIPTIFSTSVAIAPRKKKFSTPRGKRSKNCNTAKPTKIKKIIVPISEAFVNVKPLSDEDVEKKKKEIVTYTRTDAVNYMQNISGLSGLTFRELLDPPINVKNENCRISERILLENVRRNILNYAQLQNAINTRKIQLPNSSWAAHEINQSNCQVIVFTNLVLINDHFVPTKKIRFDKDLNILVYLLDQHYTNLSSIGVRESVKNIKDVELILKKIEGRRLCSGVIYGRRFSNVDKEKGKVDSIGMWHHLKCSIVLDLKSDGNCCDACKT